MSCGFQGNSDIFGIGLRTAYYLQILAIWFSNYFYHPEIKALRAVNNVFLLAVIVACLVFFVNPRQYHVVEAFLMVQIGTVTGLAGITEWTRYNSQYRTTSIERLMIRIFIMIAGGLFWTILWWKGLDEMIPTPCGTYIFWFAKINIYGWFRIVMKVLSIYAVVVPLTMHLSNDGGALFCNVFLRARKVAFVSAMRAQTSSGLRDVLPTKPIKNCKTSSMSILEYTKAMDNVEKVIVPNKILEGNYQSEALSAAEIAKNQSILSQILRAEKYLDSLHSIYTTQKAPTDPSLSPIRWHWLSMITPWKNQPKCTDKTPILECFKTWILSFVTNNPPATLKIVLFLHGAATGNAGASKIFRIVNRMYKLSLSNPPPDWRSFKIASDIRLSQIPCTASKRNWANQAISRLSPLLWLVVQVELTIVWNRISGLQSFSNLGQLIPFIIALGGLLKVLWGKGRLLWEGRPEEPESGEMGDYEMAIADYVKWRRKADTAPGLKRMATV